MYFTVRKPFGLEFNAKTWHLLAVLPRHDHRDRATLPDDIYHLPPSIHPDDNGSECHRCPTWYEKPKDYSVPVFSDRLLQCLQYIRILFTESFRSPDDERHMQFVIRSLRQHEGRGSAHHRNNLSMIAGIEHR